MIADADSGGCESCVQRDTSESCSEMLHLPILSDIGDTNSKGLSLGFGDVSDRFAGFFGEH